MQSGGILSPDNLAAMFLNLQVTTIRNVLLKNVRAVGCCSGVVSVRVMFYVWCG